MASRREFLTTVAAACAVGASRAEAAERGPIKTALKGSVGLQLWSLREALPKDLGGTLVRVHAMGFREGEGAGLWKHTAAELRAALDQAGLRCTSAHMSLERLRDDPAGAVAEAKAVGASTIICPWLPHEKAFTRDAPRGGAAGFNRFGRTAHDAGLRFGYHCHGYEFVPSPEGTLFDTLAGATDAVLVEFQIDVFHAQNGDR